MKGVAPMWLTANRSLSVMSWRPQAGEKTDGSTSVPIGPLAPGRLVEFVAWLGAGRWRRCAWRAQLPCRHKLFYPWPCDTSGQGHDLAKRLASNAEASSYILWTQGS